MKAKSTQNQVWFAAKASAFAALCAFGMQPFVASAGTLPITVDPNAAARATIGTSANGVPVVNIVAPNSAGVSNNRFTQYNVGTSGLIVNNATQAAQTQIGGAVQANGQLGGRGADVVLMQVTGGSRSQLLGTTEIAGKGANLIVANPAGISCSGCGFVNAPRVTLATGTAMLDPYGGVNALDVKEGTIDVQGNGLTAKGSSMDLIARAMTINGKVQAGSINAIAGANRVDYASNNAMAQAGTGSKPQVAIDVQALGSMYGDGAVRMIGTEAGVGVRNQGSIASLTGDVNVNANGDVSIGAPASVTGRNISVFGANVNNAGSVVSNSSTNLRATQALVNTGKISGAGVGVTGQQSLTNSGSIIGDMDVNVASDRAVLDGGSVKSGGNLSLGSREISNRNGEVSATQGISVFADSLDNTRGTLSAGDGASLNIQRALINASGKMVAQNGMQIDAQSLDNTDGQVNAQRGALYLNAADTVANSGGSLRSGSMMNVNAHRLDNGNGSISAGGPLTINALSDGRSMDFTPGSVNNATGTIAADGDLNVMTGALDNTGGKLQSGRNAQVSAETLDSTHGEISAAGSLNMIQRALTNANGKITAGERLQLQAESVNNDSGAISAGSIASIDVRGALSNRNGSISSQQFADVHASTLDGEGGTISAPNGVMLRIDQSAATPDQDGYIDPNNGGNSNPNNGGESNQNSGSSSPTGIVFEDPNGNSSFDPLAAGLVLGGKATPNGLVDLNGQPMRVVNGQWVDSMGRSIGYAALDGTFYVRPVASPLQTSMR
jgi:filamentous hemagglutinin family protein